MKLSRLLFEFFFILLILVVFLLYIIYLFICFLFSKKKLLFAYNEFIYQSVEISTDFYFNIFIIILFVCGIFYHLLKNKLKKHPAKKTAHIFLRENILIPFIIKQFIYYFMILFILFFSFLLNLFMIFNNNLTFESITILSQILINNQAFQLQSNDFFLIYFFI